MENLTSCRRCSSNACLEQKLSEKLTTWFCFGCGFTSSTELIEGSDTLAGIVLSAPELYKDLIFIDQHSLAWMPSTLTLPEKGMVFIDGSSVDDWQWSAVKAIPILEEERNKFPEGQKYKMNVKGATKFAPRDFMDALEDIGFFNLD
jgi:hypothetical protein